MNKTSLYKRHKIIYTDPVSGKFNKIRLTSMSFMTLMFFIMPWISYNGKQAFLFDLSCTRFYFFGSIFWPQDFILLALLCIIAIISLFLITLYAGRIWCGFLCPQSIWIKIAVFFSRIIEGNRLKRKKIDNSDINSKIITKKILKHSIWITFSLLTSFTFICYFVPINFIFEKLYLKDLYYWSFFWIIFFAFLTYVNIGWFREQFCFIVCPYSRLQSVMFDENTLIIAYDKKRGEIRGSRNKNSDYKKFGLGDCIDCYQCVNCCPTGIDIRNGLQMECIGCAACIDACDNIMEKMNYKKGLIKYMKESEINQEIKKNSISKFRIFGYIILILFFASLFLYISSTRALMQFHINRSQNQLYNINKNKEIENSYILKITNKTSKENNYKITILNKYLKYNGIKEISLKAEDTALIDIKLILNNNEFNEKKEFIDVIFKLESLKEKHIIMKKSKFIIPKI